jgi:hypothetical protein
MEWYGALVKSKLFTADVIVGDVFALKTLSWIALDICFGKSSRFF